MNIQTRSWTFLLALTLIAAAFGPAETHAGDVPPLKTVRHVDLNRYMGKWYEIASFPQSFQKNCFASTANYRLLDDGTVEVINRCHQGSLNGPIKTAKGSATVVDTTTNAKLEVTFFWPFAGDYWIIDLGANYEYAVVGHPNRDYLWILSRTPTMDKQVYDRILARLRSQHYDLSPLQVTPQL